MTDTLTQVLEHLRGISARVLAAEGDLAAIRAAIADYGRLNESVTRIDAEARSIDIDGVPGEWVVAANSDPDRRLLYVHGGSWMSGSPASYRPHTARLARATGCSVLAVDYRLAPEHPYPAGLNDSVHAFEWMGRHGPDGTGAAQSRFIVGDSAGGNLTLCSILVLKDRAAELPAAAVALSPATDLSWGSESFRTRATAEAVLIPDRLPNVVQAYLQGNALPSDPHVSPLFGDLHGMPPLLVQVGDAEILLDDSTRLVERALQQGVDARLTVWPLMPHVFQLFAPDLEAARLALEEIGEFIRRHA